MFSDRFFKIHGVASKGRIILWLIMLTVVCFFGWSYGAVLDEVAVGEGRVVPAMKSQLIQNLEGGILAELSVREGDMVEEGQILATLSPARARANVEEITARIVALRARAARLTAEINDSDTITFPPELDAQEDVKQNERELFDINRSSFKENLENLENQLRLADEQLKLAEPLRRSGSVSEFELLRIQRDVAELSTRLSATRSEYFVALRDDYTKTMAELEPLLQSRSALNDQLTRTIIKAPTRGIVKDIRVTTIGGVIAPGGVLMEIVPTEDQLLIEVRINPRDIAFLHPGLEANVKITAYDSGVYGSLKATLQSISADTIADDTDRRLFYYRAYVLTEYNYLETKDGRQHPIMPGMVATAEIRTGQKTVFDYLIKPLNRAGEALRER